MDFNEVKKMKFQVKIQNNNCNNMNKLRNEFKEILRMVSEIKKSVQGRQRREITYINDS